MSNTLLCGVCDNHGMKTARHGTNMCVASYITCCRHRLLMGKGRVAKFELLVKEMRMLYNHHLTTSV